MADHHGGNGDAQAIWRVQWRSIGIMEKHRLNTEFYRCQQGGSIDRQIAGDGGRDHAATRGKSCASGDKSVAGVCHQRSHDGHVETVGAERADPAVAEKERLYGDSNREREDRPGRAQHDGRDRYSQGMSSGAAR